MTLPRLLLVLTLSGAGFLQAQEPQPELLWPAGAPGALGTAPEDQPSIAAYVLPKGTGSGTAIVICPGGGYQNLSMEKEGSTVAKWLNSLGVSGFVLKY